VVKPYDTLEYGEQIQLPSPWTCVGIFLLIGVVVASVVLPNIIDTTHPEKSTKQEAPVSEPVSITLPSKDALGITKDGKEFHLGDTLYRVNETLDGMQLKTVTTSRETHSVIIHEKKSDHRLDVGNYFSSAQKAIDKKEGEIQMDRNEGYANSARPHRIRYEKRHKQLKALPAEPSNSPVSKE